MEWVKEARKYVSEILSKIPGDLRVAARETAVDVLCDELRKIPVPVIGTLLSNVARQALKSKDTGGPGIEDILELLQEMQQSDDNFLSGLSTIGEDIDRLDTLIQAEASRIEAAIKVPEPIISKPVYKPNYPVSDNELWFCLMNIGGGAIEVPEIELITESCEPEIKVDFTVPAAPPVFLRLKVKLSPHKQYYPLLKLNDEDFRRFGASGQGAPFY